MENFKLSGSFGQVMKGWPIAFKGHTTLLPDSIEPVHIKSLHIGPFMIGYIKRGD